MRQFSLFFLATAYSSYCIAQISNTDKFDTIQISKASYAVYKDWRPLLSKRYELDSTIASQREEPLIFSRTKTGLVYGKRNKQNQDLVADYKSPLLVLTITEKKDYPEFFKTAPKGVFNPVLPNKDTVNIAMMYLRQNHYKDQTKAQNTNAKFVQDMYGNLYQKFNIKLLPAAQSTPEYVKEIQQKIKMMKDSAYTVVDSAVSKDGTTYKIFGLFETDEQQKTTTLWYYGVTRFTTIGSQNMTIQYYLYVSKNKFYKMSSVERKKWFLYFLPVIKNIYNKQADNKDK